VTSVPRSLRTSVLLGVAVLTAVLSSTTNVDAAVSPYKATDTVGDAPRKADLRSYKVVYGDTVKLSAKLRKGTDPYSSPLWVDRLTGVMWLIDVPGGSEFPEFAAFFYNGDPGMLDGEVDHFDFPNFDEKACETDESFRDGNRYQVSFPDTCIGSPANIRVQAIMVLDKGEPNLGPGLPNPGEDIVDYAPNALFALSPKIKPPSADS